LENLRKYLRNLPAHVSEAAEVSDQQKGVAPPAIEKPIPPGARRIELVPPSEMRRRRMPLVDTIRNRRSRRSFSDEAMSLEDLSFLLWATQGIREIHPKRIHAFRTVPSGGCRHPFETYLWVRHVEGVPPGLWRYSAMGHTVIGVWETAPKDAPACPRSALGSRLSTRRRWPSCGRRFRTERSSATGRTC